MVVERHDTNPFDVPVRDVHSMEVLQALSRTVQLLSRFREGSSRESEGTYQFKSVSVVDPDVLHDVPMRHPL